MSGNGARMCMIKMRILNIPAITPWWLLALIPAWAVVAAGSTPPGACVQRTGTGTLPISVTSTWVSASAFPESGNRATGQEQGSRSGWHVP